MPTTFSNIFSFRFHERDTASLSSSSTIWSTARLLVKAKDFLHCNKPRPSIKCIMSQFEDLVESVTVTPDEHPDFTSFGLYEEGSRSFAGVDPGSQVIRMIEYQNDRPESAIGVSIPSPPVPPLPNPTIRSREDAIQANELSKSVHQASNKLVEKILARPPSLNGRLPVPIPSQFYIHNPEIIHSDEEDISSLASASAQSVCGSDTSSNGSAQSPDRDGYASEECGRTESDAGGLRPLTVPPWYHRSRRSNVCVTSLKEDRPLYIASDADPMKFPF
ncbi:hypothetical protein D9757_003828 [Collybiopsis confluens]|uniref:Uncharacterized protein n=1 Tax=Collybiopsis confluens TaxID=2823264 RepID=A0A8H5HV81_9AGAR|nr:hypothetical protein D9757_003828 [Collybiopsis confluens]